jgi:hypothetical protein
VWARELPEDAYRDSDERLVSRFNAGLRHEHRRYDGKRGAILKRRTIEGASEFRPFVLPRAGEIHVGSSKAAELQRINRLLAAFEARGRSRAGTK